MSDTPDPATTDSNDVADRQGHEMAQNLLADPEFVEEMRVLLRAAFVRALADLTREPSQDSNAEDSGRMAVAPRSERDRVATGSRALNMDTTRYVAENETLPWYWEGNVQARVARFLIAEAWTITAAADTASRQRGIDLVAVKGNQTLAVEVKGYPGTVYAYGPRAGQPKPTKPPLQARHWLAEALMSTLVAAGTGKFTDVAIALPDLPRYRDLLAKIDHAINKLGLRVFLVQEGGGVSERHSAQQH